jgi:hypothetical protein
MGRVDLAAAFTRWLPRLPHGRFVFAIDADGILVEYVEPAARAAQ